MAGKAHYGITGRGIPMQVAPPPNLGGVTLISPVTDWPAAFALASRQLADFPWCAAVTVEALPAPRGIAPYAAAVEATLDDGHGNESSGRLILLHDPDGNPAWGGQFRCVTYAQAPIDGETVFDQWRAEVAWSWLIDALNGHMAGFTAPSGTVTVTASTPFGGLEAQPKAEIELRASWTPIMQLGDDPETAERRRHQQLPPVTEDSAASLGAHLSDGDGLTPHLAAWQDLLRLMAGLPPLAANIMSLAWDARR